MGTWMQIRKWSQRGTLVVTWAGMSLLIPMMLLTTGDVLSRGILSRPLPGTVELSSYMLAVFVLLGLAYTYQVRAHVSVSMVLDRLPVPVALVCNAITTLLCLGMAIVVVWQGWVVGIEETTVSDMLRIPQWPFRLLVCLGGFFLGLELLIDFVDTIIKLVKGEH